MLEAGMEQARSKQLLSVERGGFDGGGGGAGKVGEGGAEKLYQEGKFIEGLRQRRVVPHVAEYEPSAHWPNFLTEAERNDPGFEVSQKKRKLVERVFGWGKLSSMMRKIKLHGLRRVDWFFCFLATAHNLVRMVKLVPAQ